MSFNYKYTCPDINKAIDNFKQVISDSLDDIIVELNPLFYGTEAKIAFRKDWEQGIYSQVESCFENTRDSNSNIRDEADKQIQESHEEVEEYKRMHDKAESEIEHLQEEIRELKERLNDYAY